MSNNSFKARIAKLFDFNSTKAFCILCFLAVNLYLLAILHPFDSIIMGHDFQYHYLRIDAVQYNIENNSFSGIDYLFFDGGGYASFAYPDLFLYIPALLKIAGLSTGASMTVLIVLCNIFSYWFMYIFMKHISKSPVLGTIGAVLYALSTYRLDNIVTRVALGEVLAGVFWPLILYGLYDFIFGKFKKPYLLGFGFVGMLLSHSISTIMALVLAVALSLAFIKRIISDRRKLPMLFITAGFAIAVTAFYWLPLIELLSSCEISAQHKATYLPEENGVSLVMLFKERLDGGGVAGMKFPIFLLCIPRMFLTRSSPITRRYLTDKNTNKRKGILVAADAFFIAGLVSVLLSTELIPWHVLPKFFNFIQFPWRFFAPASILLITAGSVYTYYIALYTKASKIAMGVITATAMLVAFVHVQLSNLALMQPNLYANMYSTFNISQGEWLPLAANDAGVSALRGRGENVLLDNSLIPCERKNGTLTFVLSENETADHAELPYIWYKGYEAEDENGNRLDISMSDIGLVQVDLRNAVGKITVEHKPTTIRIVSYFISLAAIVALIITTIFLRRKRRRGAAQSMISA